MQSKLVSVVIPVYNRENTIIPAIKSVLNQDYENLEIIVIDDGSTDHTAQRINQLNDKKIRYIYQNNSGACAARNNGIAHANGEYIAFHDSDDIWKKEKLKKQLSILVENKADIVFSKLDITLSNGSHDTYPKYFNNGIVNPIKTLLGIGTQTLMMKAYIAKNNMFDPMMPRFQELEFLIRATKNSVLYCIDEPLVEYKVGKDSISTSSDKLVKATQLIYTKHPYVSKKYPLMAIQLSDMLCGVAKQYNNKKAYQILKLAKKYNNTNLVNLKISLAKIKLFTILSKLNS